VSQAAKEKRDAKKRKANAAKIYFVTTNKGKLLEANTILQPFGIRLYQIEDEKPELQEADLKKIVVYAAEQLAKKHKKAVLVEDSGLFLRAYQDFPGALTKHIHHAIGFDGLFRLLEGKTRKAYFKAAICYAEPGKKPAVFEGILKGRIADKAYAGGHDQLVHDQIFIADGYEKTLSLMQEEKQKISHRTKAFQKFAKFMQNNFKRK
jgi:XTP/dITP diphosphohydrolase